MNRKLLSYALIWLSCILILASCLDDFDKVNKIEKTSFGPAIDFPLVNSDFDMQEFLSKGKSAAQLSEQNGVMVLTYDDSLLTPPGDNFFTIPDQHSPVLSITGPEVSFPSPGATVTITKTITFDFATSSSENLDSVLLKAGQLQIKVNSTFPANINLKLSVPSLKIQGSGFSKNFTFNGPGNQSPSVSLQGASADLTSGGTSSNKLTLDITATITDTGQPINSTHRLDCSFDMNNLNFRALFGDLGTKNYPFKSDSINVDVFGNSFGGSIDFLSPAFNMTLINSFGLPLGFDVHDISAVKQDQTVVPVSGPAVTAPLNPYLVTAPSYSQIGQSMSTVVSLNSNNSNLSQLVSVLPRHIAYRINATLNPAGATKNFVLDDSQLKVKLHLELPFYGKASKLVLSKKYEFKGLGVDGIQQSKIIVKTSNELPLDAAVQAYFVDANGGTVDSLFINPSILKGAPVDGNGFTQAAADLTTEVPIDQAKIDRIDQAQYLVLKAILYTSNGGTVPVKFSASDRLKISIGVNTRVKYTIN